MTGFGAGILDSDFDGLSDLEEFQHGTNPRNPDTDGDELTDGEEVAAGSDPNDPNSPAPPGARTRYVSPTGGHVAPFRTWAKAARDIQSAIDATDAGDTEGRGVRP